MEKALAPLRDGKPARTAAAHGRGAADLRGLQLLTVQARALRLQRRRGSAADGNAYSKAVEERARAEGAVCVVISAKIEAEFAVLPAAERDEFLAETGPRGAGPQPADPRGLPAARPPHLLHRRPQGGARLDHHARHQAPQAAGVIHTDFEKGFIRAETIAYDDYVSLGGENGAKDAGKMRLEGKEYVVKDGDVMHFRFAN